MKKDHERLGVKVSVVGSSLLASSAIVMALIAKSQAILLDGLYNFITLAMALVSLRVITLVEAPETKTRPFGYMALEPFLNLTKSVVMITLLIVFLVTNIQELCTGGRIISLNMATLYIFICLVIYAVIILILRKYKKETSSSILEIEMRNWYVDAFITAGIAISLLVAMVLLHMGYAKILPYVDPIIVIALVLVSFPVPIKIFVVEFRRLLLVSPENCIEAETKEHLQGVINKHGLVNTQVWGLKSGRTYYLFVYAALEDDQTTIEHLDEIRAEIFMELSKLYPKFWADIIFTKINPDEHFTKVVAMGSDQSQ